MYATDIAESSIVVNLVVVENDDPNATKTKTTTTATRPKGFFARLRRQWPGATKPGDETESTADVDEHDSLDHLSHGSSSSSSCDPSDNILGTASATYDFLPDNKLHSCLHLLSSNDLDQNRLGLQRLNLLTTSGRIIFDGYGSNEIASSVLVFGGPLGSMEELLRFIFVTMICDNPHTHCDYTEGRMSPTIQPTLSEEEVALEEWALDYNPSGDSSSNDDDDVDDEVSDEESNCSTSSSSSCSSSEEDEDCSICCDEYYAHGSERKKQRKRHSQGKAEGVLHNHALKILANALGEVFGSDPKSLSEIPLHCSLWKSIVMSLVENIESNHSAKATVYSMKILRFLYFVQPQMILPLLRYTLFAILVDLEAYGLEQNLPMMSDEASKLLKVARDSGNIVRKK